MRKTILTILSILIFTVINAQTDSTKTEHVELPNAEYTVYQYDSVLQVDIITYQYSNLWDLDNDGIADSVSFIGNGGAHTYFYLEVWLSSSNEWTVYPTFQIDMPYLNEMDTINEITQFTVFDFDKDGKDEIYLNIDNPFGSIPEKLKTAGLTSKQILFEVENNKLIIRNLKTKTIQHTIKPCVHQNKSTKNKTN